MIGKNIAPGLSRSFASEEWEAIPGNLWKEERKKAFNAINNDVQLKIFGSDINPQAVKAARLNAEEAGVDDCIKFYTADVSALRTKSERGAFVHKHHTSSVLKSRLSENILPKYWLLQLEHNNIDESVLYLILFPHTNPQSKLLPAFARRSAPSSSVAHLLAFFLHK